MKEKEKKTYTEKDCFFFITISYSDNFFQFYVNFASNCKKGEQTVFTVLSCQRSITR